VPEVSQAGDGRRVVDWRNDPSLMMSPVERLELSLPLRDRSEDAAIWP
jgi:hypothetical protein